MLCTGSRTLVTPRPAAVPGISCVRPRAPAPEPAFGLKPDSCLIRPASSAGSMPLACAAWVMSAPYGTLAGSAEVPVVAGVVADAVVAVVGVVPLTRLEKSVPVAGSVAPVALASALENDVLEGAAAGAAAVYADPIIAWI